MGPMVNQDLDVNSQMVVWKPQVKRLVLVLEDPDTKSDNRNKIYYYHLATERLRDQNYH